MLGSKKRKSLLQQTELDALLSNLIQCCLTHVQDRYRLHLNRIKGVDILNQIICKGDTGHLTPPMVVNMTWACLSCLHHFHLRMSGKRGFLHWTRSKQLHKATITYMDLLRFLLFETMFYSVTLSALLTFLLEANLWDMEFFCADLIKRIFQISIDYSYDSSLIFNGIFDCLPQLNVDLSIQILNVVHLLIQSLEWDFSDYQFEKIAKMYYDVVIAKNYSSHLQKAWEMCLRSIIDHCDNYKILKIIKSMLELIVKAELSDEELVDFGNVTEYAAMHYKSKSLTNTFKNNLFIMILEVIGSENILYSLLGLTIFQFLIDRCNNRSKFDSPRIFNKNETCSFVIDRVYTEDKHFFLKFRKSIHFTFLAAVLKHGVNKIYLENCYVSIALLLVEIPCDYTAAAVVCLTMAIQKAALTNDAIGHVQSNRLHATIGSIISLVCYIHKAETFYDYLNVVLRRRAQQAPHLNPPLRNIYEHAQHHVLWDKSDLFFEDWECRYGLLKCFRAKQD